VAADGHHQRFLIDGNSLCLPAALRLSGIAGGTERHGDKAKALAPRTYPAQV
jgi:hypothetical protein